MQTKAEYIAILETAERFCAREIRKLEQLSEKSELPISAGKIKPGELGALADDLARVHKALKLETEGDANGEDLDVSKLSLDEVRTLERLTRKTGTSSAG